jgi:hypothetical protein
MNQNLFITKNFTDTLNIGDDPSKGALDLIALDNSTFSHLV